MALALGPQCCCERPGIWRWGNAYAFVDPNEVDVYGCLEKWASWMYECVDPGLSGCAWGGGNFWRIGDESLMGYDSHRGRVYVANGNFDTWGLLESSSGIFIGAPVSSGGVSYFVLDENGFCDSDPPLIEAISDVDGLAILEGSDPGTFHPGSIRHGWTDLSNDRFYGRTQWFTGSPATTQHFKAWSVATDGSDYTEHFSVSADNSTDDFTPVNMCVNDGHVYTFEHYYSGFPKYRFRMDGTEIATMTPDVIVDGTYTLAFYPMAMVAVDNQVVAVCLTRNVAHYDPFPPRAIIVEDGTTDIDQFLRFVATEDEVDVEYYPYRIGWDDRARATVILWAPPAPLWPGAQINGKAYVTYHTKALVPGNILGQDKVKVYAGLPFDSPFAYANSPFYSGVVIPGKMPPPLTVTGTVIEPPPPPPPEPNSCDDLDSCVDLTAVGELNFNADVSEGAGTDYYLHDYDGSTWLWTNLNRTYDCTLISGGVPSGPATGYSTGQQYDFWCPLTDGNINDYNHPGILLRTWDFVSAAIHREDYITDVIFGVDCVDGELIIKQILLFRYSWYVETGGSDPWPPVGVVPWVRSPLNIAIESMMIRWRSGYVSNAGCDASEMDTVFRFDSTGFDAYDHTTFGDIYMEAKLEIGSVA